MIWLTLLEVGVLSALTAVAVRVIGRLGRAPLQTGATDERVVRSGQVVAVFLAAAALLYVAVTSFQTATL